MTGGRKHIDRAFPAVAVALVAVGAGVWWVQQAHPEVALVSPQRGDAAEVVYATGTVEPRDWAKVVALHRRRIVEICDCEGKRVRKGDVLARLDNIEERAVLNELQARRKTLKADAERILVLLKRNVTTQVAYDEKLTQLSEQEARIAAQNDRLYDLDLRAPVDGVVLRSDATVGEIAGTGNDDVLFWVGEPSPLEINADVNEEDIAKVSVRQRVLLRHDGFVGATLPATVDHITPKGDPEKKTFNVTLALPKDTPLQIGMSVEANIVVMEAKDVLLVPAEALLSGHVLTVDGGRVRRIAVKTGIRGTKAIEIVSGLAPDTRIISPAGTDLAEGVRVRIKPEPSP